MLPNGTLSICTHSPTACSLACWQGYFHSALAAFETRTAYANRSGDHLVSWANSSLRSLPQLPKLRGK